MQAFFKIAGSEQAGLPPYGMGLNGMTVVLNYRYSHMYRINGTRGHYTSLLETLSLKKYMLIKTTTLL